VEKNMSKLESKKCFCCGGELEINDNNPTVTHIPQYNSDKESIDLCYRCATGIGKLAIISSPKIFFGELHPIDMARFKESIDWVEKPLIKEAKENGVFIINTKESKTNKENVNFLYCRKEEDKQRTVKEMELPKNMENKEIIQKLLESFK
jgi:hypothetical protein